MDLKVTNRFFFWRNVGVICAPLFALVSFFHGCSDSGAPFEPNAPEFSLDTIIDTVVDSLGDTTIDTVVDTLIDSLPDTTIDTTSSGITFNNFVGPLFVASCDGAACHNSVPGASGFSVTSYSLVIAGGQSGAGVIPGDTAGSIAYQKLLTPPLFGGRMPQSDTAFSQNTLDSIARWILDGAPEN